MIKKETESFVKIESANMVKLSLKELAGLYADYVNLILSIKKIKDNKQELRKQLFGKILDLEKKYEAFTKDLPALPKGIKLKKPQYPKEKPKDVEFIEARKDSFEDLMEEFEDIREQLEKIR